MKAVDELPEQKLVQLIADIDRVSGMTDEVGQTALLALADWRVKLEGIDSAYRRAHWLYVQSRDAFRQAEEIRYADEYQNAQRLWDGFVGPRFLELKDDPLLIEQFKEALQGLLAAGRIHVEIFNRIRSRRGEPDREIRQITVYSEDIPVDEVVFTTSGIRNQARKPVRETAITYEPASGTIEVVGRVKSLREQVASQFAQKLLGVDLSGERLPPRRVDLTPLLDPMSFPVDPQDGIARVKLTRLVISSLDGGLTQWFDVPFGGEDSLHEVLDEQYGEENPLRNQTRPWLARIEVQFEPERNRMKGKKIAVVLSLPTKCNLRGKTEKERLVLDRYLRAWGLLRGADA
ncbi:MAG TPA: hypothetical protein VFT30_08255 [Nitrospira sp.]|nr:hypothetical protein [Nitrospira sp.]